MAQRKPPILVTSSLTGRVYVATSYTDKGNGLIVSHTKHDVTEQFVNLVRDFPITDAMVDAFGAAWHATPAGEPGARRRAGLRAALEVATAELFA